MLILSKRLHSIFLLRCFNDSFAILFLFLAIYAYQKRQYTVGSLLYSWGLGIKMSLILSLPAFGVILFLTRGIAGGLRQASLMMQLQVLIGLPFLQQDWKGYLSRSFELSRQFFFKWTVNWRFVPEDIFLSKTFAGALLLAHLAVLGIFVYKKWNNGAVGGAVNSPKSKTTITPDHILLVLSSSNFIGILFARSLHYQFYVWYFHMLPFLLWKTRLPVLVRVAILLAIEVCWNTYPSTSWSSLLLIFCHATIVLSVYLDSQNTKLKPHNQYLIASIHTVLSSLVALLYRHSFPTKSSVRLHTETLQCC